MTEEEFEAKYVHLLGKRVRVKNSAPKRAIEKEFPKKFYTIIGINADDGEYNDPFLLLKGYVVGPNYHNGITVGSRDGYFIGNYSTKKDCLYLRLEHLKFQVLTPDKPVQETLFDFNE